MVSYPAPSLSARAGVDDPFEAILLAQNRSGERLTREENMRE